MDLRHTQTELGLVTGWIISISMQQSTSFSMGLSATAQDPIAVSSQSFVIQCAQNDCPRVGMCERGYNAVQDLLTIVINMHYKKLPIVLKLLSEIVPIRFVQLSSVLHV